VDGSTDCAVVTVRPALGSLKPGTSSDFQALPESEIYCFDDPHTIKATGISNDLLLLNSVSPSLSEYLTSQTRARNLYVDANIYHTQMAEFFLDQCPWRGSIGDEVQESVVPFF